MKKMMFLSMLALLVLNPAYGQLKLGLGLSLSDFSESPGGESKAKAGFQIGGSYVMGKRLYVEPGAFYTVKSTEYISVSSTENKAVIQGLRIPVSVGLGVLGNEGSTIRLRAFGGFSGFFVTGTGDDIEEDDVESPMWGAHLGAGLDFLILYMDLSYEWSLTNVQKDISTIDLGKQRTFYVTVGIYLWRKDKE